jgi:hypothetical protein
MKCEMFHSRNIWNRKENMICLLEGNTQSEYGIRGNFTPPGGRDLCNIHACSVKRKYMRAVMREMIQLLGVAGIESAFGEKISIELPTLTYDEFAELRPQYSAVSWRGTAAKLLKERLIIKTLRDGKIALQLTRAGIQTFLSFFQIGVPPSSQQTWQLCLLSTLPGKRVSWVEGRRLLRAKGFVSIQPQVFLRFRDGYDGTLAQELVRLNFLTTFIAVRPDLAQPAGLQDFVEGAEQGFLALQRRLLELSKELLSLLSEVSKKKNVHSKDKKRIGNILLSGLALISDLPPGWYLKRDRYDLVRELAANLKALSLFVFSLK